MSLASLIASCAPLVDPVTAAALIHVESSGNPHAIGVVGGRLQRQPQSMQEAIATVRSLEAAGFNYSVGLGQINKRNFARLGLSPEAAFQPCANLQAMQTILGECYERALTRADEQTALRKAFSCYYSGNFRTGFLHGYVHKVVRAAHHERNRAPK